MNLVVLPIAILLSLLGFSPFLCVTCKKSGEGSKAKDKAPKNANAAKQPKDFAFDGHFSDTETGTVTRGDEKEEKKEPNKKRVLHESDEWLKSPPKSMPRSKQPMPAPPPSPVQPPLPGQVPATSADAQTLKNPTDLCRTPIAGRIT
ncbi:hypothetical protein L596_008632 [Steinernema carpocapsae]|uniref:Uncharacterized protein n=1 Tax=Steinernema carpocapsae TaxID=34508 RepID=A0A4U5PD81_STECR|nr:hypothetical protein L596_008632 [Steinernema carpocapsae]